MNEMKLISKEPGSHAYKKNDGGAAGIPNVLDRKFRFGAE
jgi:putative transposase